MVVEWLVKDFLFQYSFMFCEKKKCYKKLINDLLKNLKIRKKRKRIFMNLVQNMNNNNFNEFIPPHGKKDLPITTEIIQKVIYNIIDKRKLILKCVVFR